MEINKRNTGKILAIITFTILLFWGIHNLDTVGAMLGRAISLFSPFILGASIAFIINTPMRAVERCIQKLTQEKYPRFFEKKGRMLSIIITFILVILVIAAFLGLVIPGIGESFGGLVINIQNFYTRILDWINASGYLTGESISSIDFTGFDWHDILSKIQPMLFSGAGSMISSTVGAASAVVSGVVNFFLGIVFSIYVLAQKEKLARQCKKLLYAFLPEEKAFGIVEIGRLSGTTFSHFLAGQCTEAVILGTIFFVVLSILQFPYALIISVMIAFLSLIPIFGAFIGCALGMFLIVMVNPMQSLWFLVVFLVIQQIEGNLIYPRVVGSSVGLPSIWVLVAVTVGGSMMGVVGMIVFIPLFSVLHAVMSGIVNKRLSKKKLTVK